MELENANIVDARRLNGREIQVLFDKIEKQRKERFKRDGMVAFFDVLGYKNIAMRGDEGAIRKVMDAVEAAHAEAKQLLDSIDLRDETTSLVAGSDFAEIECVNISDSLVFHEQFPDGRLEGDLEEKNTDWFVSVGLYRFLRFCRKVYAVLLERGLPTRGAVSIGTYYWNKKNMLAGKPVIDSYLASESLSFSGVVLSDAGLGEMRTRAHYLFEKGFPYDDSFLKHQILVPTKTKSGDGLSRMDVLMPDRMTFPSGKRDQFVTDMFKEHGKRVDNPRVCAILKNTLEVLRRMDV